MLEALRDLEKKKLVSCQRHPFAPLSIWNYTAKCQYERAWFFNLGEHQGPLPTSPFRVLDKLDGSLGILYGLGSQQGIATRGSFTSDQAKRATGIFLARYRNYQPPQGTTAVFEIIYPENRIVVDYAQESDLYHLGLVDNATGLAHFALDANWPGPTAKEFDAQPLADMPDEVMPFVREHATKLTEQYATAERECKKAFSELRRDFANKAVQSDKSYVLFAMLDKKPYAQIIWKSIEPLWIPAKSMVSENVA